MTTDQHPITPPPELVEQWKNLPEYTDGKRKIIMVTLSRERLQEIATQAANWGADQQLNLDAEQINQAWQKGADQELEACCEWLLEMQLAGNGDIEILRADRRPKPPSLNEVALQMLGTIERDAHYLPEITDTIRRALEQLDD